MHGSVRVRGAIRASRNDRLRNARFWESHAVARHGRTAIAALRLNWSGLGRWISDQIRQQEIDEGSQFAASQRGVLSNLRYSTRLALEAAFSADKVLDSSSVLVHSTLELSPRDMRPLGGRRG